MNRWLADPLVPSAMLSASVAYHALYLLLRARQHAIGESMIRKYDSFGPTRRQRRSFVESLRCMTWLWLSLLIGLAVVAAISILRGEQPFGFGIALGLAAGALMNYFVWGRARRDQAARLRFNVRERGGLARQSIERQIAVGHRVRMIAPVAVIWSAWVLHAGEWEFFESTAVHGAIRSLFLMAPLAVLCLPFNMIRDAVAIYKWPTVGPPISVVVATPFLMAGPHVVACVLFAATLSGFTMGFISEGTPEKGKRQPLLALILSGSYAFALGLLVTPLKESRVTLGSWVLVLLAGICASMAYGDWLRNQLSYLEVD